MGKSSSTLLRGCSEVSVVVDLETGVGDGCLWRRRHQGVPQRRPMARGHTAHRYGIPGPPQLQATEGAPIGPPS